MYLAYHICPLAALSCRWLRREIWQTRHPSWPCRCRYQSSQSQRSLWDDEGGWISDRNITALRDMKDEEGIMVKIHGEKVAIAFEFITSNQGWRSGSSRIIRLV